jgi:hypothetical protein
MHPDFQKLRDAARRDRFICQFGAEDGQRYFAQGIDFDAARVLQAKAAYGKDASDPYPLKPYVQSAEFQRLVNKADQTPGASFMPAGRLSIDFDQMSGPLANPPAA